MSAKNNRPSAGLDFYCTFAAHFKANQRAQEWAARCLAYREAGKHAWARYAEHKARRWLKKAMLLEGRAGPVALFPFRELQGFAARDEDE